MWKGVKSDESNDRNQFVRSGSRGGSRNTSLFRSPNALLCLCLYRTMSIQTALTTEFPELSHLTCILCR